MTVKATGKMFVNGEGTASGRHLLFHLLLLLLLLLLLFLLHCQGQPPRPVLAPFVRPILFVSFVRLFRFLPTSSSSSSSSSSSRRRRPRPPGVVAVREPLRRPRGVFRPPGPAPRRFGPAPSEGRVGGAGVRRRSHGDELCVFFFFFFFFFIIIIFFFFFVFLCFFFCL